MPRKTTWVKITTERSSHGPHKRKAKKKSGTKHKTAHQRRVAAAKKGWRTRRRG